MPNGDIGGYGDLNQFYCVFFGCPPSALKTPCSLTLPFFLALSPMHKFRDSLASSSGSSSNHSDESNHEEFPMLTRNESPNHPPLTRLRKRQQIYLACIIFAITSTLVYFATSIYKPVPSEIVDEHIVDDDSSQPLLSHPQVDLLDPSLYLNGPPAQSFRGTSFPSMTVGSQF